ncbi:hypothetical protein HAX54_039830 [Datura stramonium]|uniref:Uncharacterized protein n=1 Tax=Datura stramonium TaxID=4076 RepID=A0ABS8VN57_DATST|nr:hypothetical protein [Datura stramonium]
MAENLRKWKVVCVRWSYMCKEARDHSFPLVEKSNLLQMVESGGCPPPMNIASQFSNYNLNCYSFAGHSGKQLQSMQQTEGNSAAVQNY